MSFNLVNFNRNFENSLKNYLKKENKKIFIDFLKENHSLENPKCSLIDTHFISISKVLKANQTLKILNGENNKLTNKITSIISELVKQGICLNLNYKYVENT